MTTKRLGYTEIIARVVFTAGCKNIVQKGLLSAVLLIMALNGDVRGQRVYADGETHSATQAVPITGIVLSEVRDPSFSVNSDYSDKSTLFTTLGVLSLVEAWQNIRFSGSVKPKANSPVTIKFGTTGSSIITVIDAVSLQPTLNGVAVGTPYANSTLLGLLGVGATDAEITLPAPGISFDGMMYKISSTIGLVVSGRYYYAFFITPPTVPAATVCTGSAATLTIGNPQSGYTYNWYSSSSGGTALQSGTGTSFTTPPLSSNTSYWVEAVETATGTNYYSGRTQVDVTVIPLPTQATTGANQSLCSVTSATLTGNTPTVGTGTWTRVSGPNTPTISSPNSATTTVTGLTTGSYLFRWSISNGSCTASTSDVIITISTTPAITISTMPSACQQITTAPMTYSVTGSPSTYSITWNPAASAAGFQPVTNATLTASPIQVTVPVNAATGVYSGTITVKNSGGCQSIAVPVTLTVHTKPVTPNFTVTTN